MSIEFTIEVMGRVMASRLELPVTTALAYIDADTMTQQEDIDSYNEHRFQQWVRQHRED